MILNSALLTFAFLCGSGALASQVISSNDTTKKLHELFDKDWQWGLKQENTAKTENDIIVEIDRYSVWPVQGLAYKLGELKIKELRARAKHELGAALDVRKFHNAVLDDGPLPLDVQDERINEWIAEQKRKN